LLKSNKEQHYFNQLRIFASIFATGLDIKELQT
jgi:hypothetical protein